MDVKINHVFELFCQLYRIGKIKLPVMLFISEGNDIYSFTVLRNIAVVFCIKDLIFDMISGIFQFFS